MTSAAERSPANGLQAERATTLALRLAHAENALRSLTAGQVDAIIDPDGRTYLLRPAQESLRQNERRLQAMLDGAADVITVVDRGGRILSQSRGVTAMLGFEPEELVGRSLFEIVYEEDLDRLYAAFFNVIEGFEENATVQFYHPLRGGSYRQLEATVGKLRDAAAECVVFVSRPMQSQAPGRLTVGPTAESLSPDRFLAMLSHELRTPLTPVVLGIDELQQDERFAAAAPILAMMRRNLDLQARLLSDLVDFTSIGQHKLRLHLDTLDAHEVVRFVHEICRSELAAAQVELRLELHAATSVVLADSLRLQQVLWNLLKNAIKFSAPGTTISITTRDGPAGRLVIEVTDQGIGIEPELLPLVFDCFQQGAPTDQTRHGSLGLGLFIAKGMAEAQGGTLTAHSRGRGHGATFRLILLKSALDSRLAPAHPRSSVTDLSAPANPS